MGLVIIPVLLLAFLWWWQPAIVLAGIGLVLVWWWLRRRNRKPDAPGARWATPADLKALLTKRPAPLGLLLGRGQRLWLQVRQTPARPELGHMLVVGPPRSGKGLLATSQLLSWQGHALVSDPRGELWRATAGYRAQLGPVFLLDAAAGVGHRYDPTASRQTPSELRAWATSVLADEQAGSGAIYVQRSIDVLSELLLAARAANQPGLAYVAQALAGPCKLGGDSVTQGAWASLPARLGALLDEPALRTMSGSDVAASAFQGKQPVTVYVRWPEASAEARTPLVRALLVSLVREILASRDSAPGELPVLALIDEAGSTFVPDLEALCSQAASRHVSLMLLAQSTAQLAATYGRDRANAILASVHHSVYFRPNDQASAEALSRRLGQCLDVRQGQSKHRASPVDFVPSVTDSAMQWDRPLAATSWLMLRPDHAAIVLTRGIPPAYACRADWRLDKALAQRQGLPTPPIEALPALPGKWLGIMSYSREEEVPHEITNNGHVVPDDLWNIILAQSIRYDGCLLWTGPKNSAGYGKYKDGRLVHRLAWMRANGEIPGTMTVHHTCHQRTCLEVTHLSLLTRAENAREARDHAKAL